MLFARTGVNILLSSTVYTQLYCFFLSVMPPKDLAPFSYISPQKTLFSTIKYELTIEFLSANG